MIWHRIASLARDLFRGRRFSEELDQEMQFHLDCLAEDLIREGMDPREARREAKLRFGSQERARDRSREERGLAFFDELTRNVRFSFRSLARKPLLAVTFVLTLGLCVGASTAVFSVVDAVLWEGLPYPQPGALALAVRYNSEDGIRPQFTAVDGTDWERIRDGARALDPAVFSGWGTGVNLESGSGSAFVQQQRIGAGYFRTLGVTPARGREFQASEDVPGGPALALLSHGLWERTFGGDLDILGRTIRLKGEPHTVIGIMPQGFEPHLPADVWTPLRPNTSGEGSGTNYQVVIRIPDGMTPMEASNRLARIEAGRAGQDDSPPQRYGLLPLDDALEAGVRTPVLLVFGAVLLMLLVGCANLAGLQVARFLARRPEIATRQALGGGAGVLSRQLVTENLVLGLLGGAAGLAIAHLAAGTLAEIMAAQFGAAHPIRIDGRAVAASAGFTGVAMLFFGLAPVLRAHRLDLRGVLVGGARGLVGGKGHTLRKGLLVGQVALVTALLFSAGLLVRSYGRLQGLEPGFDPEGVLTLQLSLDDARFASGEEVVGFFQQTLDAVRRIPAVQSASVALSLPYERPLNVAFQIPGVDADDQYRVTNAVYVMPGFLETLDIPLLSGRALEAADAADAPGVILVNRAFVEANLEGDDPLGRRIAFSGGREWEMVGIVGDVQQTPGFGDGGPIRPSPTIYFPAAQAGGSFFQGVHIWFSPSWLVKGSGNPTEWAPQVTRAIESVNAQIPVARTASLSEIVDRALIRPRLGATFLVMVAAFALALSLVGLYGIIANEAMERRSEMGLRMALGATPADTIWTVGSTGLRLVAYGLGLGALLSLAAGRVLAGLIWGVTPFDPPTILMALGCLCVLGGVSSFLPTLRLGRLDPSRVLQDN